MGIILSPEGITGDFARAEGLSPRSKEPAAHQASPRLFHSKNNPEPLFILAPYMTLNAIVGNGMKTWTLFQEDKKLWDAYSIDAHKIKEWQAVAGIDPEKDKFKTCEEARQEARHRNEISSGECIRAITRDATLMILNRIETPLEDRYEGLKAANGQPAPELPANPANISPASLNL